MSTNETRGPIHPLIIIGSGPAGYTAAIYAGRAGLRPFVYAGYQHGGQLALTTDVENFPGFPTGVLGPSLIADMRSQAERFGAQIRDRDVTNVDFSTRPFRVTADEDVREANSVIVATGASARELGVPGEDQFRGMGVSTCATCDGYFFRGKRVAVVGGGDTAIEEALFLSRLADEVLVFHRRDRLRASGILAERALETANITVHYETRIEEVVGDQDTNGNPFRVTGLRVRHVGSPSATFFPVAAVFVAIGHDRNSRLFRGQLAMDRHGYLLPAETEKTAASVMGVFLAGDVRDHRYRQAITAAADGARAAIDAERWLSEYGEPPASEGNEAVPTRSEMGT